MRSGTSPLAMFLHQMGVTMGTYMRFPTVNEWSHAEWEDVALSDPLCSMLVHPRETDNPRSLIESYVRVRSKAANGKPWGAKSPFMLPYMKSLRSVCEELDEPIEVALTDRDYRDTVRSLRRQSDHLSEFERGGIMPATFKLQETLRDSRDLVVEGAEIFHVDDTIKYPRMAAERLAKMAGVDADLDVAIRGFRGRGL